MHELAVRAVSVKNTPLFMLQSILAIIGHHRMRGTGLFFKRSGIRSRLALYGVWGMRTIQRTGCFGS